MLVYNCEQVQLVFGETLRPSLLCAYYFPAFSPCVLVPVFAAVAAWHVMHDQMNPDSLLFRVSVYYCH